MYHILYLMHKTFEGNEPYFLCSYNMQLDVSVLLSQRSGMSHI